MNFLALLLACSAVLPAQAQGPSSGYTIAGKLSQRSSGEPLRRTRVVLQTAQDDSRWISTTSDNDGQFSFTGLAAGRYRLAAEVSGGQKFYRENEGFSTLIVTGPDQDSGHIAFALEADASIEGTIVDEEGDPASNAQVTLFHRSVAGGRHTTRLSNSSVTDATGRFHFRHLHPGAYFIAVQGKPWFAQHQPLQSTEAMQNHQKRMDVVYPLTYYPGTTNPADASLLHVSEGSRNEVHLVVQAVPALHIDIEGQPPGTYPQLFHLGVDGLEIPVASSQTFTTDKRVELLGMPPGNYVMRFQTSSNTLEMVARMPVTLTGDTTVNASQLQQTSVAGNVLVVTGQRPQLMLSFQDIANGQVNPVPVEHDGSFRFSPQPGRYEVQLLGEDLYAKAITVTGAAYAHGELDVHEGAHVELSVTVAKGLQVVNGVAFKEGRPYPGAMILLVPRDVSHGDFSYSARIPRDQSDGDGTFTLTAVPPGRYTLLALDGANDLPYHDAAAIAPYLKQGQVIEVPVNSAPTSGVETKVEVQRLNP